MPQPTPSDSALLVEHVAHAKILRIHNPGRANAMDDGILRAIVREVEDIPPGLRVIVLTGSGDRHFSAGLDLGDAAGPELAARLRGGEALLGTAAAAIAACRVPVVGMVNGAAFGGALELAVACDWRIAVDGARLGMPAARLGVVYAPAGLSRFVALLGPARTRQLFVGGRPVTAERAFAIGLVDEIVNPEDLDAVIAGLAADVAAAGPAAVAGTRAAVGLLADALPAGTAGAIDRIRAAAYGSPEFTEALAAFRERRPPNWDGAGG
jgi:enoyl-CoA hydratase/carnithine racemase